MKKEHAMRILCSLLCVCLCAAGAAAQESPFVTPEMFRTLSGEISGDISYDHLRHLTLHHSPNGASRGFQDKMRWIAAKAREVGLEDVRLIDDLRFTGVGWTPLAADLWIVSPDARRVISLDEAAVAIADYSVSGTWEGELVDVDAGTREAHYEGKDVKGKIVLASGAAATVMNEAVWKRGALGVIYYNAARGISYPDQVAWTRLNPRPPEGKQNTFAFSISYRAGMELKQRLAPRATPGGGEGMQPGEKITMKAVVQSEFEANPKQWIVEGWIRGTNANAKHIVLTAHGQEEKTSANDDNSGCANLLEIARAFQKLIREGKLARPARSIRFWWVNEISAPYEYFATYPDERGKVLANVNQDMVGAKQSAGSRIQHITRTPWSRPSYLNAVVHSIARMVMRGNTGYIAAGQAGSAQPYSRAILSRFGTRERYGAEIVPHFNNTDHMVFNDSIVGIPGITLTNYPDEFIHSSDDDLWQMDATQLGRNAFIVAASAWYLAALGPEGLGTLASQVHGAAQAELAQAYARATEMLALAAAAERDAVYADALNLIQQSTKQGLASLDSLREFAPAGNTAARIEAMKETFAEGGRTMLNTMMEHYSLHAGRKPQHPETQPEIEREMQRKLPEVAVSVKEYLEKRRGISGQRLHSVMAYEVWNMVDGKRSYLEIYRAVRAEAQFAGAWYYGNVTAKQVNDLLDSGVKAGFLKIK
jgi:hypothetical protein